MIDHIHKIIFVHIPKTGGSSIEKFFNIAPFDNAIPNYDTLTGFDKEKGIFLQHATADQLLSLNLIPKSVWDDYFKVTFVRNPFDKLFSEYRWVSADTKTYDSFENFINKKGKYFEVLNDTQSPNYRGDHLTTQFDFLQIDNEIKFDFIGRFENFEVDIRTLFKKLNINKPFRIHEKKAVKSFEHYSHFFSDNQVRLIEKIYDKDLAYFNYKFENQFKELSLIKKVKTIYRRSKGIF